MISRALLSRGSLSASRVARNQFVRGFGLQPEKMLKDDSPQSTPINTILDRTAEIFFMTEIFRGLWLMFETTLKTKVTINYPFEKGPLSTR